LRKNEKGDQILLAALNFTPVPRYGYKIGVPLAGKWEMMLHSDEATFGGTDNFQFDFAMSKEGEWNGKPYHIEVTLPPLGILILKHKA
jgi:1,4-alpha-glucan branching enzyme